MNTHDRVNDNDKVSKNPVTFTCAHCGGHTLDLVYDCLTAFEKVTEVYDNGEVYVTGPIEVLEDHGHWYRCHECGKSLLDWDSDDPVWKDDYLLVEWLLENCPQEQSNVDAESEPTRQS